MRYLVFLTILIFISILPSCNSNSDNEQSLKEKANELAQNLIIIDTHIDIPARLHTKWKNISQSTEEGNFDYPRAIKGGLNAPFMSIYIPASYQLTGGAKELADTLIDMVNKFAKDWSDKFIIATSPSDIINQFSKTRISICMGMENGAPIEGDIKNLKYFYDRGIRYITLTHSKNNKICDSSYDDEVTWNGLSPFGIEVVKEMNRLGIMVDISHVSDSTFYQVIKTTAAPVIASHSSSRYFTPGWQRNMSDDMIKLLAENGGVIQINFGSSFLRGDIRQNRTTRGEKINSWLKENNLDKSSSKAKIFIENYDREHPRKYADVKDVADHIDHIINLVGIDHLGIGSDFDGVGDSLPTGLKDVSGYPNLIYELLKRGYSENDIEKICSENLLRVWKEVEQTAKRLQLIED
ncbi:MAG: dipeptidase [Bacteroidetes bacterium]|nr:dipeptidase [Bacteroidota bacterium]